MKHDLLTPYDEVAAKSARPLYFVPENALSESGAPQSLASLATLNGFKGSAGAVLVNDDGALCGAGEGDMAALAAAAEKLPEGDFFLKGDFEPAVATKAAMAWLLGGYRFDRYKDLAPPRARLIAPANADLDAARRSADAVALVRDLVNTPASDMGPDAIEAVARDIALAHDAAISVTTGDDLLTENFPMVHAVGRAAAIAPRLIDITYGPADAPKVTLVGKGVTFDSGGLNIKGAAGMALMKKDMGGAAHVLALGRMIMRAELKIRLRILVPAVENAISGNAFRPGDVLDSRAGMSVEIGNTDAEGRLILADAMALAREDNPALVVTLATLTGAARVALGPELPPFYCDDDDLAAALEAAARRADDPVWRMPLWPGYASMLASSVADISHISNGPFAGSITAALFLKRFAPETAPWMHFDIYAWRPKSAPGRPAGGEAQAIRALYDVIATRFAH
ncbi:MAG: leucyl aminopeptidase family protein [Pseudomonadota bacterium]